MLGKLRIPIRFKFLVMQLLVVIAVLSLITYTMAKLFHTDKTTYIRDLTSVSALHSAEEAQSLLVGYQERLKVFARLMANEEMFLGQKEEMLKGLFEDFREFVMVTLYQGGKEQGSVYDAVTLRSAELDKDDMLAFRRDHPLPLERILGGEVYIGNSTLSQQLPTLTLAMALSPKGSSDDAPLVAVAVVRLDRLLHLADRAQVMETFVMDSQGVLLVHPDHGQVAAHTRVDWIPQLQGMRENRSFGGSAEYAVDGVEMLGALARVESGDLIAAVQIPRKAAFLTARELLDHLVGVALALLLGSALLSFFWSYRLTRPIEKLSEATRVVARGDFDIHVEPESRDEIGDLSESFNSMATGLKEAQAALVQSEKMAAFGQLGAGIAHEVKNPLGGILGLAQFSQRKVEKDSPVAKNLSIIEKETRRCKEIVENLLKFARQEKVAFEPLNLNQVAEDSMSIVAHQLAINQVKLHKELAADLPQVIGNSNQLQQVLINFLINAQQAMDGEAGEVRVVTRPAEVERLQILVSDTGPGIPKEIQAKIFEPFFTTKAAGKGTGLGLSVTYGIIQEHKGAIEIQSEPGQGTTFIVTLPVAGSAQAPPPPEQQSTEAA